MINCFRFLLGSFLLISTSAFAAAQTVTSVSNLNQTAGTGGLFLGNQFSTDYQRGYNFTTGASNLSFTSVTIRISSISGTPSNLAFSLYSGLTSSGPTGLLSNLTGNTAPSTPGDYVFSAPSAQTLLPDATYWLIGSAAGTAADTSFNIGSTQSTDEDSGALSGWSIGNTQWISQDGGSSWAVDGNIPPAIYQFSVSVQGSPVPEPATYAILLGLAVLGVAVGRRCWLKVQTS